MPLQKQGRGSRHPVEFEVTIRYRQRRFPVAFARNLSPEGMYVQTVNLTLPTGTLVEIELDRWGRQWLIPAVVVDSDVRGVGLMFRTPQPELYAQATSASAALRPPEEGPGIAAVCG